MIGQVLAESGLLLGDIDLIACGVGPGPFTGLRVGIATALTLAEASGLPCVGACSLDAIAWAAVPGTALTVLTRARRAEVNLATYDEQLLRTGGPMVVRDEGLHVEGRCLGDAGPVDALAYPRAADLGSFVLSRLAAGEPMPEPLALPEDAADASGSSTAAVLQERAAAGRYLLPVAPIYLRRPDAAIPEGLAS